MLWCLLLIYGSLEILPPSICMTTINSTQLHWCFLMVLVYKMVLVLLLLTGKPNKKNKGGDYNKCEYNLVH